MLDEWRKALVDGQEQIWASQYDKAMGVLAVALR